MQITASITKSLMLLLATLVLLLSGCAGKHLRDDQALEVLPARHKAADTLRADVDYNLKQPYDPWEGFNRSMYKFNFYFDKYVFLPVVSAYEAVLPDFVEQGISNFFKNIGEIKNLTNSILQLHGKKAATTTARFVVNTTIGVAGLWDPATRMGLNRVHEDFGQTLGYWGLGPGPYIVLPILGPSSLRDTTGFVADTALHSFLVDEALDDTDNDDAIKAGLTLLQAVDERHLQSFRYYESGNPAEYDFIRYLYLKKRELDIMK